MKVKQGKSGWNKVKLEPEDSWSEGKFHSSSIDHLNLAGSQNDSDSDYEWNILQSRGFPIDPNSSRKLNINEIIIIQKHTKLY